MIGSILRASVFALAALVATQAAAADFTIRVPVKLKHLPSGARPTVTCDVVGKDPGGRTTLFADRLGGGRARLDSDADFDGMVTVGVDLSTGKRKENVTRYRCHLSIDPTDTYLKVRSYEECLKENFGVGLRFWECGADGAKVVGEIHGSLRENDK